MARSDALLRLHQTLTARRTELRKRLGVELGHALGKGGHGGGDAAEAAFRGSGEELSGQLAELEARELAQVERALRRLTAGTYGKCEGCGAKIPVARLNALPYSTLCIGCQREMEAEGGWGQARGDFDWTRVSEHADPMAEKDVTISDLEIDLSK